MEGSGRASPAYRAGLAARVVAELAEIAETRRAGVRGARAAESLAGRARYLAHASAARSPAEALADAGSRFFFGRGSFFLLTRPKRWV